MNSDRQWQISALLAFIIATALTISSTARADANSGDYLGFRLGDTFVPPENAAAKPHVAGPLIYEFQTESRDHGVESKGVFVSPESLIIGSIFGEWYFGSKRSAEQFADRYLVTLRRKYEEWRPRGSSLTNEEFQLSVEVQKRPGNGTFWPSTDKYRVAVSLIHSPDSLGREEWMAIVYLETSALKLTANEYRSE